MLLQEILRYMLRYTERHEYTLQNQRYWLLKQVVAPFQPAVIILLGEILRRVSQM
jgi:hypothetical protein